MPMFTFLYSGGAGMPGHGGSNYNSDIQSQGPIKVRGLHMFLPEWML